MSELTPETLAEWRKDAKNGALLSGVGKDRRIAVLIDALHAEKAAREEAERAHESMTVQFRTMQAEKEHGWIKAEQWEAKYEAAEARAEEAERKFEQQVEFRREYERMAEKAEQERDEFLALAKSRLNRVAELEAPIARVRRALDDELQNLADDGARLSHSVVRRIEAALTEKGGVE